MEEKTTNDNVVVEMVRKFEDMPSWTCVCVALDPSLYEDNLPRVMAGSGGGVMRIINVETGRVEEDYTHTSAVFHILHYDRSRILISDSNGSATLFEYYPKVKLVDVIYIFNESYMQFLKIRWLVNRLEKEDSQSVEPKNDSVLCGCCGSGSEMMKKSQQICVFNFQMKEVNFLKDKEHGHTEGVYNLRGLKTIPNYVVSCGGGSLEFIKGSSDYSLRLWDWKERKLVKKFECVHKDGVRALDTFILSQDLHREERIVSTGYDGIIIIWSILGLPVTICDSGVKDGFYTCRLYSTSTMLEVPQYIFGAMDGGLYSFDYHKTSSGVVVKKKQGFSDYVYSINYVDFETRYLNNHLSSHLLRAGGKEELFVCSSADFGVALFSIRNICAAKDEQLRVNFFVRKCQGEEEGVGLTWLRIGGKDEFSLISLLLWM